MILGDRSARARVAALHITIPSGPGDSPEKFDVIRAPPNVEKGTFYCWLPPTESVVQESIVDRIAQLGITAAPITIRPVLPKEMKEVKLTGCAWMLTYVVTKEMLHFVAMVSSRGRLCYERSPDGKPSRHAFFGEALEEIYLSSVRARRLAVVDLSLEVDEGNETAPQLPIHAVPAALAGGAAAPVS